MNKVQHLSESNIDFIKLKTKWDTMDAGELDHELDDLFLKVEYYQEYSPNIATQLRLVLTALDEYICLRNDT